MAEKAEPKGKIHVKLVTSGTHSCDKTHAIPSEEVEKEVNLPDETLPGTKKPSHKQFDHTTEACSEWLRESNDAFYWKSV